MKKTLLILSVMLVSILTFGQSVKLVVPIVKTGETQIEVEDDNDVVIDTITISISTDDGEQENDEMDTLIDDDIDCGWEGADGEANILTAGLRFQNITIPHGAVIDSAFIVVTSHEPKTAEDVAKLTITAEATDNAATFSMDALITARTSTTASVAWTIDEEWGLWTAHQSPDVKAVVQEIIDRSGWETGNAMAFILEGENQGVTEFENAREWESFENIADPEEGGDGANHAEHVPQLVIYYHAESYSLVVPIIKTGETQIEVEDDNDVVIDTITISISTDDAEQENDEMDTLIDDDIDCGWEGADGDANILTAGLRFQNITIPQGATIETAYIEVSSHEPKTAEDEAKLTIFAEATDNAVTFSMDDLITARTETAASVKWDIAEEWGLWTAHQTPELKSIVQEIVNRSGWVSGNAIAFIITGENQGVTEFENGREWESFENIADPEEGGDGANHADRAPKLYVTFKLTTAINDFNVRLANKVKVYPNPTKSEVNIALSNEGQAKITFYNQIGMLVKQVSMDKAFGTIDINNLPAGMYYIQVEQNNQIVSQKLIVE
jgi:hypothetical protein